MPSPIAVSSPPPPSIGFYINIGHTHAVDPDLRGNFWEWQIPNSALDISVVYMGDGQCQLLAGHNCTFVSRNGMTSYRDDRQCLRTENGWGHFLRYNSDKRWYFKGVHDTFINLSRLEGLLFELERQCDPMREIMFAFNLHDWDGYLYPQGGSGWVFSHFAVDRIWANWTDYHKICDGAYADDVALAPFLKTIGINVTDYAVPRFAIYWPLGAYDRQQLTPCPVRYFRGYSTVPLKPVRANECIAAHMHHVPMDVAAQRMQGIPDDVGIAPYRGRMEFCNLTEASGEQRP